ncbi:MAG: stalk domain-containing protein [Bacillota bacterium]|nr:stalk domain-containing protein [Thermoanaerobacteraceae bacterium]
MSSGFLLKIGYLGVATIPRKWFVRNLCLLVLLFGLLLPAEAAQYTYDSLGRLKSVIYENGLVIEYSYDPAGNVLKTTTKNTVPLYVYKTIPANGATGVPVNQVITIIFSKEVQPGPNFSTGITLRSTNNVYHKHPNFAVPFIQKISGNKLLIDPVMDLDYGTDYVLLIGDGVVQDLEGNPLHGSQDRTFTTRCSEILQPQPKVILNGRQLSFDVPLTICRGRILVPIRTICEALGAEVTWNGTLQLVRVTKGFTQIGLKIGEKVAAKNGVSVVLDAPAEVVNGRTMVPLRFISETMGATVGWDSKTRTITITNRGA